MRACGILLCTYLLLLLPHVTSQQVRLGETLIKGISLKDTVGRESYGYIGIPFAEPPVGALRFADPVPIKSSRKVVLTATRAKPMCMQAGLTLGGGSVQANFELLAAASREYFPSLEEITKNKSNWVSEDCLYLNVYVPAQPSDLPRPVMVYIHGGGFVTGSANHYDARSLAASQDVIVVTIQYRLGAFGFLSTGDGAAEGNWGLKDQTLALQWVKDSIAAFGGDPGSVTIFGTSAGSISVALQTKSPAAKGLFQRSILQSGTESLLRSPAPLPAAQALGSLAGCSKDAVHNTTALLECLRAQSPENILTATHASSSTFFPVIDGEYVRETPSSAPDSNHVDLIIGYNSDETAVLLSESPKYNLLGLNPEFTSEEYVERLRRLSAVMGGGIPEKNDKLFETLLDAYPPTEGNTAEAKYANKRAFQRFTADQIFRAPAYAKANKHKGRVWMYELSKGPGFFYQTDKDQTDKVPKPFEAYEKLFHRMEDVGADHTDEIFFVFGHFYNPSFVDLGFTISENDIAVTDKMMSFWGQFARGVTPWPAYDTKKKVMYFNPERGTARASPATCSDVIDLWTITLPKISEKTEWNGQPGKKEEL